MKTLIISIVCSIVITTAGVGYAVLSNKHEGQNTLQPAAEVTVQLTKMQSEMAGLKETMAKQAASLQQLTVDNSAVRTKITELEQQLKNAAGIIQAILLEKKDGVEKAGSSETESVSSNNPNALSAALLNQISTGEVFKDPQVAKIFQEQVAQAMKNIQEEQRQTQAERFNEQAQQRIANRITDFAKKQNLSDYQQQELLKNITESNKQGMDLFTQLRDQKITQDEFNSQRDTIRKGIEEKAQQILLAPQYEEFKKSESSILSGPLFGGGGRNQRGPNNRQPSNPQPQTQPQ
jgi:hypothetical protein